MAPPGFDSVPPGFSSLPTDSIDKPKRRGRPPKGQKGGARMGAGRPQKSIDGRNSRSSSVASIGSNECKINKYTIRA